MDMVVVQMITPQNKDELLPIIRSLCNENISSFIHINGILANISSYIYHNFEDFNWVGFYYLTNDGSLVLGPFQGEVACFILLKDKGVCQKAVHDKSFVNIEDVHLFPTHIACDSKSVSELVVPIMVDENVVAVLDIDSRIKGFFSKDLEELFKGVGEIISTLFEQGQAYLDIPFISKHYKDSSEERDE